MPDYAPIRRVPVILATATLTLLWLSSSVNAQTCDVDLLPAMGGVILAQTDSNFETDPELDIEVATDLSFVRLENSKIRVVYSAFHPTHPEFAITEFVIKQANEDQAGGPGDFMAAGAGRGPISAATVLVDEPHRKTVRMEWSRWSIPQQQVVPSERIIIDVSIYPNQAFLQFDNLDIRWHSTVTDLASPGGITSGVHVSHGAAGWNRGYNTHDEAPFVGSYYDRYPPDGVDDPEDGGSLNYNGHFVMAVYNPANGRGFGRVLPVADTSIIKLLMNPGSRRGLETGHHPFYNAHPPFTSYLYIVEAGSDPLAAGRALADSGGVQPTIGCGDALQLTAQPYTAWLFSGWTDDLLGESENPTVLNVDSDLTIGAGFSLDSGAYTNNFDASNPGDDPTDWLDTAANNSLVEDDTLFQVMDAGGDRVFGTTFTSTNIHSHYVGGAGSSGLGYEMSGRLKVTDVDGGVGVTIFSQMPSQAAYYRMRRLAGGSYHLSPFGTSLTGETDTGVVPLPDVWYRFRLQAENTGTRTEVRAMVWKDGFAEPGSWQVEAVDDSPGRLTDGNAGLWAFSSGAKYIDDVAINVLQPPPSDLVLTINEIGSGSVVATPDLAQYTEGDVVILEATGSSGQVFGGWSGDLSGFENPTQMTMLGDQSVTATFITPTVHTVALDIVGQGTVAANPNLAQYFLGDSVELTATPDSGWGFTSWSGDLQGSMNPSTLTISGDMQVGATFVASDLVEDFESVAPGENAPNFLDTGAGNSLTEDDAKFSVMLIDGEQALGSTSNKTNFHSHHMGPQLDGLGSYEFTGRMRIEADSAGIGVTFFSQFPDEVAYYRLRRYEGTSFHLSPVSTALGGVNDTGVIPIPGLWYHFRIQVDAGPTTTEVRAKVWSELDSEPALWQAQAADSAATRLVDGRIGAWAMGSGGKYWDDFRVDPIQGPPSDLTLDVTVVGNGNVTATPDQVLYALGDSVNLQATADTGYLFTGWSGDASGTDPSIDVTMNGDTSVVATFVVIQSHPLTVSVAGDGDGSAVVSPDLPSYFTGDVVTLTATPASDSTFAGWSGDVSSSENPLQVTIFGPTSVTANFTKPNYANNFEGAAPGDEPANWFDTGANNSLVEAPGLFAVQSVDGQNALGTNSTATNIHTHWMGPMADSLTNYRFSGRFRMSDNQAGVGITALSQMPDQLAYYRLRRYQGTTIHLAPIGTSITGGNTDSGIVPFADTWYRFILEVEDTGTETLIRAKVWDESISEPAFFQIAAVDASATRLTAGSFGMWSMGPGSKYLDDISIENLVEPRDDIVLSANATFGGSVQVTPSQATYSAGDDVMLEAIPDAGFSFSGWSGDLTGSANPETLTLVNDASVTANFAAISFHTLSLTVSGDGVATKNPDTANYELGTVVTLSATPNPGSLFVGWSGDLSGAASPVDVSVTGDLAITAVFAAISYHSVSVSVSGDGTFSLNPTGPLYQLGSSVTLTATPNPGTGFAGWSGDVVSGENPLVLQVTGDLNLVANFAAGITPQDFTGATPGDDPVDWVDTAENNSLNESDGLFGVVDVSGNPALGTTSTLTNIHSHYVGAGASALTGYEFTGRLRKSASNGGIGITFFSQFPTQASYYRLRSYRGNALHIAPLGTLISGGTTSTGVSPAPNTWYLFRVQVEDTGSRTEIQARVWEEGEAEPTDWPVSCWDDSATRLEGGTIGTWAMSSGSKLWDDLQVGVLGPPPTDLVLTVASAGNGSVLVTPDLAEYTQGDIVTLEAQADPGWVFSGWSGDLTGNENPTSVTMLGDRTVTATFLEIAPKTLTLNAVDGTIIADPDQSTYQVGESVTLTAVPDPGLTFIGWSGALSGSQNPQQLTITDDAIVNAEFGNVDYFEGFDSLAVGSDPAGWVDTDSGNSLSPNDALFAVLDVAGQNAFGTASTATNIHSHYDGAGAAALTGYRYSGRMMMTDSKSGIGVTFMSQFPNQAAYYRLRRYSGKKFHLSPLGTSITSGVTDTGVNAVANSWYQFLIEVEDTGSETLIRGKVWAEGDPEPAAFQVDAVDASPTRLTSGTVGVWSFNSGSKYYDDLKIELLP